MQLRTRCLSLSLTVVLCFTAGPSCLCAAEKTTVQASQAAQTTYQRAVVAADHPLASEAGVEVFRKGGNVVDAAVAVSFTLSVVRPASCGIGGGGFMLIYNAGNQSTVALDYRERAPCRATRDMFLDPADPTRPNPTRAKNQLSRKGHLASAVPGTVAGLCYAQQHYGLLDLKTVLQPAIRLAREGVPPDPHFRSVQKSVLAQFEEHPDWRRKYAALYKQYLNNGKPWKEGDRFYSPQLKVLQRIAERGPDGFYTGPVAEALVAESRRGGGLFTLADLAATRPVLRQPLRGRFDNLQIFAMPPASSGGVALLESLNMLTAWEQARPQKTLEKLGHNSPASLHLLAEIMKHAFADRAEFLGDADFADVPVKRLIDPSYAARLAAKIDPDRTQPPEAYGRFLPVDDAGTSHFSIIDHHGNAVACTETINTRFGSFVVEPEYGIVLNNQMDDFAAVPGRPNAFGLIQSEANAVAPGKKPLSSMSPTIAVKDGRAVYALGASGGPRIISSTLQVFLNMTRFDMSPLQAVTQPRIHHQWIPDTLFIEEPLIDAARPELQQRNHDVQRRNNLAAVQAVSRTPDGLRGASQPSKHGKPAGY